MWGKRSSNKDRFLYKKTYLARRLQHDVMENGIAYIPCKVRGMEDIISRFSISGVETTDAEFLNYITDYAEFIPPEYPLVLEIYGPAFSEAEKRVITETITSDLDYLLGKYEDLHQYQKRKFLFMMVGTVVSGIVASFCKLWLTDIPLEFFYVIFWLFADSLVRYLFIEKRDFREGRIRMGRLASMKVNFVEQPEQRASPSGEAVAARG